MALYSAKKWVDISSYGLISFPMHRGAKWAKYILGNDSHLLFYSVYVMEINMPIKDAKNSIYARQCFLYLS